MHDLCHGRDHWPKVRLQATWLKCIEFQDREKEEQKLAVSDCKIHTNETEADRFGFGRLGVAEEGRFSEAPWLNIR